MFVCIELKRSYLKEFGMAVIRGFLGVWVFDNDLLYSLGSKFLECRV